MKDKTTAALLAFLLGGLGAHKFYLDESGKGVLYLLFCWTFIPAFVAFFEFINFLVMDEQDFNRKYNNNLPAGGQRQMPAGQQSQQPQQMGQNITVNLDDNQSKAGVADELEKLHNLYESGALTKQEFEQQKRKLLSDD